MKLIKDNKLYVQKKDFSKLFECNCNIKLDFINKYFFTTNDNGYEFVNVEDEQLIDIINNTDWIIDFSITELPKSDIKAKMQKLEKEKQELVDSAQNSNRVKKFEPSKLAQQCQIIDFELYQLRDALWIKEGIINIDQDVKSKSI